ncbi:MAG TPA: AMP-binding protein [Dehalococcoidia bacterium]|nr:AMP-binding protein [Dehalococcoidia bacterium]
MTTLDPSALATLYPRHALSDMLAETARRLPDKPAFIDTAGNTFSFARVWKAARGLARFLQVRDRLQKGETVAVFSPNCPEFAVALHGALLAGAKVTPLNPLYREREVEHQLDDAEAVVIFAHSSLLPPVSGVQGHLPRVRAVHAIEEVWALAEAEPGEPAVVTIDPLNDLALLPYSSGTTGLPKGVMLTHYNLTSNIRQSIATGLAKEDAVLLAFLPFYHIYGATLLLNAPLAVGATCVIMPRFDAEQTLALIEQHGVTDLFVAPPALLALVHHPAAATRRHDSLRFILSGAAPLPAEVSNLALQRFGCPVIQGYGMTEASPVTNAQRPGSIVPGSVGAAIENTEEKVVDRETFEPIARGEVGELLIRGPQIMRGYWKSPAATEETLLPGGWLRSGDIARMDAKGEVFILDRAKEMIKYKGYQIAPAELESLIMEHPAVLDAAVTPKPAGADGEQPKAYVVLKPQQQASADELLAFVAQRVAPYKKLREVEFVAAIPKNPSGKILRRVLIEQERARAGQ